MKFFKKRRLLVALLMFVSIETSMGSGPYPFKELDPKATHAQRVAASQIPAEILDTISTQDLIETCLSYPFRINLYAFNSYKQGLLAMLEEFNGLRELFKRDDAASLLLQKYVSIDPASINFPKDQKIPDDESIRIYKPLEDIKMIEVIINHDKMWLKLMDTEKKRLGRETINKIHLLRKYPAKYANPSNQETTAQLMTRFIAAKTINIDKTEDIDGLISIVEAFISK